MSLIKRLRFAITGTILLALIAGPVSAQNLETLVDRFSGVNAEKYLQPLVTAFAANLNSGLYKTAEVPAEGFHFNIRFNGMAALMSDAQKTFMATTEGVFDPAQVVESPTVIGATEGAVVEAPNGTRYAFSGGYDISSVPTVVPTATIAVAGTEASFRFFKLNIDEDIGDVRLIGGGLRHSLSQYIPNSSFDLSIGAAFNKFELSDIISLSTTSFHTEIGKSFSVIDLYAGVGYGTSHADISYDFTFNGETSRIELDLDGRNRFRGVAGFALNLVYFHINADFNVGIQKLLNVGVTLGN